MFFLYNLTFANGKVKEVREVKEFKEFKGVKTVCFIAKYTTKNAIGYNF